MDRVLRKERRTTWCTHAHAGARVARMVATLGGLDDPNLGGGARGDAGRLSRRPWRTRRSGDGGDHRRRRRKRLAVRRALSGREREREGLTDAAIRRRRRRRWRRRGELGSPKESKGELERRKPWMVRADRRRHGGSPASRTGSVAENKAESGGVARLVNSATNGLAAA